MYSTKINNSASSPNANTVILWMTMKAQQYQQHNYFNLKPSELDCCTDFKRWDSLMSHVYSQINMLQKDEGMGKEAGGKIPALQGCRLICAKLDAIEKSMKQIHFSYTSWNTTIKDYRHSGLRINVTNDSNGHRRMYPWVIPLMNEGCTTLKEALNLAIQIKA